MPCTWTEEAGLITTVVNVTTVKVLTPVIEIPRSRHGPSRSDEFVGFDWGRCGGGASVPVLRGAGRCAAAARGGGAGRGGAGVGLVRARRILGAVVVLGVCALLEEDRRAWSRRIVTGMELYARMLR